jgi:hypothetical protein
MAMLDAVYVDAVEEKAIVAIRAKPAFRPLLEIATTRQGSGIVLITQPPRHVGAADPCSWWRRGRVEAFREHGSLCLLAAA